MPSDPFAGLVDGEEAGRPRREPGRRRRAARAPPCGRRPASSTSGRCPGGWAPTGTLRAAALRDEPRQSDAERGASGRQRGAALRRAAEQACQKPSQVDGAPGDAVRLDRGEAPLAAKAQLAVEAAQIGDHRVARPLAAGLAGRRGASLPPEARKRTAIRPRSPKDASIERGVTPAVGEVRRLRDAFAHPAPLPRPRARGAGTAPC